MREVQQALACTNIPVYAGAWHTTAQYPEPPDAYLVYTTRLYESEHYDDRPVSYTVYVYLNLWSKDDPTDTIPVVRQAMRAAGFALSDEEQTFEADTDTNLVAWTWEYPKEA